MLVGSCVGCSGEGEGLSGIGCVQREVGAIGRLVSNCVDPAFRLMRFPLNDELDFYFENDFIYQKNDLKSPLIFILFLKG